MSIIDQIVNGTSGAAMETIAVSVNKETKAKIFKVGKMARANGNPGSMAVVCRDILEAALTGVEVTPADVAEMEAAKAKEIANTRGPKK